MSSTFEVIERYWNKELIGDELIEFEKCLLRDNKLRNLVNLHFEIDDAMSHSDELEIRSFLLNLNKHVFQNKKARLAIRYNSKKFFSILTIAAMLILIIMPAILQLMPNGTKTDRLFSEYFYQNLPYGISRSIIHGQSKSFSAGIQLYHKKLYHNSLFYFLDAEKSSLNDKLSILYAGHCYLQLKNMEKAISCYKNILNSDNILFQDIGLYYVSLAYLKNDDLINSKLYLTRLQKSNTPLSQTAIFLLKDINHLPNDK